MLYLGLLFQTQVHYVSCQSFKSEENITLFIDLLPINTVIPSVFSYVLEKILLI
jgi:hypothetical protein